MIEISMSDSFPKIFITWYFIATFLLYKYSKFCMKDVGISLMYGFFATLISMFIVGVYLKGWLI